MIPKHEQHDHYFIEDGWLCESYQTIRGLRFQVLRYVDGLDNMDKVDDITLKFIKHKYYHDQ